MKLNVLALGLLAGADAFAVAPARPAAVQELRGAAVQMQFFNPKKDAAKPKGGPKGSFYDNEFDSRGNKVWSPDFAENGERDLATEGAGLYVAFVPFLLFGLAYLAGFVGSPYSKGNF